jgi:hypothetical protein
VGLTRLLVASIMLLPTACGETRDARSFTYAAVKTCFERTDGVVYPSGQHLLMISYANTLDDAAAALLIAVGSDRDDAQREVGNALVPKGSAVNWQRSSGNLAAVLVSRVEPHGDPAQLPKVRSHAEAMYARCVGE